MKTLSRRSAKGHAGHFDFIIVGAGSAGCVLANRLSAAPAARVLLLEAGGWDRHPWLRVPLGWPRVFLNRLFDWNYTAEAEQGVTGRAIEFARGRVIGGSSSTNAMAYVRGHRGDYDRWAAQGLDLWSYDQVLPYFRRQENWQGGSDDFRGAGGPLSTQENRYADELIEAYRGAANQAGYPNTPDYNGAQQEGFARWQMTIRNGRRCSAADAFLRPALGRPNLEIATGVHATRILFDQTTAKGIEFTRGDRLDQAFGREIILSAGVVNSPQLLMLSGIGDAGTLAGHGIAPLVSLPGVGENLQDHMSVAVTYARRGSGPLHRVMRADRIAVELAKAYAFGRGLAADLPAGVMGFLRTDDAQALPDLQLMFNAAPFTARPYLPPFTAPYADGFASRLACLRPESRGSVTLRSADPMQAPVIRQNFFSARADLVTLRNGIEIAREIAQQPALRPYLHSETLPGPGARGDTELEAYIRRTAITVHHPSGTCRMGVPADRGAVVDQHLKVFGIEGLRVIDASVIPNLIGGNINAPTMMIADRAADFLLSDASSDHAHAVGPSHSRSRLFETQVS